MSRSRRYCQRGTNKENGHVLIIMDYFASDRGYRSSSARLLPSGRKNGYTLGGRQFIERFKVGLFVPMHFVASGFESSWRMKEFTDEKCIPFWEITKEGETIEICAY